MVMKKVKIAIMAFLAAAALIVLCADCELTWSAAAIKGISLALLYASYKVISRELPEEDA